MRQRRHTLQVSTFPFLAVLLCTMGSLILLLLVIDRRARVVARAKALRAAALVAAEDAQAQARRQAELEHRQQALHAQLQKQDQDVLSQIQTANQENTAAGADVRREQTQIQELQKKIQTESARLTQEQKEIQARRAKVSQTTANTEAARRDLARLNGDLTQLERTLADLKEARQRDAHKYSLVPYRGRRGDGRRPLYVECGDESIIFHPERASLAGLQMTLGNIRTEVDQRLAHKRQAAATAKEKSETPYLLLLVRPNGVRTYYKVLSALEGLKIDFGYEFVDADWVLDFPENGDAAPQPWMVAEQTAAAPPATSRTSASKAPAKLAGGDWSPIGSVDGSASGPTATVHGPAPLAPGGRGVGGEGETAPLTPTPLPPGARGFGSSLLPSRQPAGVVASTATATGELRADGPNLGAGGVSPLSGGREPPERAAVLRGLTPPAQQASPEARNGSGFSGTVPGGPASLQSRSTATSGALGSSSINPVVPFASGNPTPPTVPPIGPPDATGTRPTTPGANPMALGDPRSPGGAAGLPTPAGGPRGQTSASASSGGEPRSDESTAGSRPILPPVLPNRTAPPAPPPPRPQVFGNRDWFISLDCTADGVRIYPGGRRIAASDLMKTAQGANPLLPIVQSLITRRQAMVHPGEPPYRPVIRFLVHPDGLRTYYLAYPALESLSVSMVRENVRPEKKDY